MFIAKCVTFKRFFVIFSVGPLQILCTGFGKKKLTKTIRTFASFVRYTAKSIEICQHDVESHDTHWYKISKSLNGILYNNNIMMAEVRCAAQRYLLIGKSSLGTSQLHGGYVFF